MFRAEIPCDPRYKDICKYSPNCHQSDHHLYPRSLGKQAVSEAMEEGNVERAQLVRNFVKHPLNRVVTCRRIHDFLDSVNPKELPSEEFMKRMIEAEQTTPQ